MLGQFEVGFVLRVALGFTVLVSVFYLSFIYLENSEKAKINQFLGGISEVVSNEIYSAISELPENSSIVKKIYIPSIGDPFAGNYFITLEKENGQVYLIARSYRWRDAGVIKPLYINSSRVDVYGSATPTILCLNITRKIENYTIKLVC